jgi:hypothetical protein
MRNASQQIVNPMDGDDLEAQPGGTRVGSGRKSDEGFCSLECFAQYYRLALSEKLRLLEKTGS